MTPRRPPALSAVQLQTLYGAWHRFGDEPLQRVQDAKRPKDSNEAVELNLLTRFEALHCPTTYTSLIPERRLGKVALQPRPRNSRSELGEYRLVCELSVYYHRTSLLTL